jgi:hypothetical protein
MTIQELEDYFHGIDLPKTAMLNKATKINDVAEFLKTNFMRAKGWKGDPDRNSSLRHLQMLHDVLENQP